jgi:oligopeptide/dipeptide ABC transporter ATP-binding protein
MRELREKFRMALILITHDLGVVAEMAERVAVMYGGEVVEMADVETIFNEPLHPYTKALHRCIPRLEGPRDDLFFIKGTVPELNQLPPGCPFSPRCDEALEECSRERPVLKEAAPGHQVKCWRV